MPNPIFPSLSHQRAKVTGGGFQLSREVTLKKSASCKETGALLLQSAKGCFVETMPQARSPMAQTLRAINLVKKVLERFHHRHVISVNALLLAVMLATGLFALGCKKSGDNATAASQTNMVYNYAYDKREVFIDDASADLKELEQGINELSDKVTTASKSVMTAEQPKIKDLHKQQAALGKELDALKNAKEADWNQLKADYQKEESQMKVSLQDSWKLIQNNIAGS